VISAAANLREHSLGWFAASDHEFLEEGPGEWEREARDRGELFGRIMCLPHRQLGRLPQSTRPHDGQVDARSQRQQALVGADIRSRLLAAYVLLARLESEHPAPISLPVRRLPDNPPRHLPHVFLAANHDSQVGASIAQMIAQRLPSATAMSAP